MVIALSPNRLGYSNIKHGTVKKCDHRFRCKGGNSAKKQHRFAWTWLTQNENCHVPVCLQRFLSKTYKKTQIQAFFEDVQARLGSELKPREKARNCERANQGAFV